MDGFRPGVGARIRFSVGFENVPVVWGFAYIDDLSVYNER